MCIALATSNSKLQKMSMAVSKSCDESCSASC
jgi:hypothetical protein